MNNLLTIAPSPHQYANDTVKSLMYGVIIALIPTLAVSLYFFGIGALLVICTSVISAMLCEFLIAKFLMKKSSNLKDGSAIVTGILLAFNLPSNLSPILVIIGAFVAIGIGKMSFGGLGNNPFNPALVGRVFLLVSFPVQMTSWPLPIQSRLHYLDAVTGATPLGIIKAGLKTGENTSMLIEKIPSYMQMIMGNMGGSLGEVAAAALVIGFIYLLVKKIITWHIPISVVGSVILFTGILWIINPEKYINPAFHVLTGGVLLGAIFMATDYVTSPMNPKGQIIFGVGIGIITVVIRIFGVYPEGVSFAILIMNAFVPLINRYIKPKRFGEEIKNGN